MNQYIDIQFDWKFYLQLYKKRKKNGIINETDARSHYLNHGCNEKRAPNLQYIKNNIENAKNIILKEERNLNIFKHLISNKSMPLINILIRTSSRPNSFHKCIESIWIYLLTIYLLIKSFLIVLKNTNSIYIVIF